MLLAVKGQLPLEELHTTIYAHPTFRRAVEDAVRALH
jgi:hypothetical protein